MVFPGRVGRSPCRELHAVKGASTLLNVPFTLSYAPAQAPLADLYAPHEAPSTPGRLAEPLARVRQAWARSGGERALGTPDLRPALPLPRIGMWSWQVRPGPQATPVSRTGKRPCKCPARA